MALKYRDDKGLAVLALAEEGDLERLADLLTHDETDGNQRMTQELLETPGFAQARTEARIADAWQFIAAELQTFGGDGVANRIRSMKGDHTGVPYQEILDDIAKCIGADIKAAKDVSNCEEALILKMLAERYVPKGTVALSPHARAAAREFNRPELAEGSVSVQAMQDLLWDDDGFFFDAIAILRRIPQFSIGATVAANALRMWSTPAAGVTGPALRITIPAMLEVARIRRKALRNPINLAEA